jgi:6-pyruvoyltetrahydropterin/6-carboxytetrahydropterin synthase
MLLTRKYHFYAAHRNQELCDKCRNIHGHQYEVRVTFDLVQKSSITTLFADLDAQVAPIIKEYDHGMLIDVNDPLYAHLLKFPETLKFKEFDGPTSVENLVKKLYNEIRERTGLNVYAVEVDETKSSTLRYTTDDAKNESAV